MSYANLAWEMIEPLQTATLADSEWVKKFHPAFIQLCMQRGLTTIEQIEQFIDPDPQLFHDPFLMYDMKRAVERIEAAVAAGEQILIFGDYDADGITSTTILVETLESIGAHVHYYIPNRFKDGYGPNCQIFDYYIQSGISLIITVDCGIAAHEAVAFAMEKAVDVIVTDHHEIPPTLPNAYAVIHPRHPAGNYPFGDLSGAGVALKVATAILGEVLYDLMEVAAIGTVADLVSLTDENRTIVKQGLRILQETQRVGLIELFEQLNLTAESISSTTIGFVLGPRFNALGRLGDASPGVELLLTFDQAEAEQIVVQMNEQNQLRQEIVEKIVQEAIQQLEKQPPQLVQVLVGQTWHEGVLGIVASKIVEVTQKPTIVLTQTADGLLKGSARSISAFNIYEALQHVATTILKFGGHHMAAGLSLQLEQLEPFIAQINKYAESFKVQIESPQPILIDTCLNLSDVTIECIEQLQLLEPFGTNNTEPVVLLKHVSLTNTKQIGTEQQHLKAVLAKDGVDLQVIGFHKGHWLENVMSGAIVSAIGTLGINEWQGNRLPQLMLKDLQKEHRQFFDWRTSTLRNEHFQVSHALYVTSQRTVQQKVQSKIPATSQAILWEELDETIVQQADKKALIIVDCPRNREVVERVVQFAHELDTYVIAYSIDSVMTSGIPTHEQFKIVYRYLQKHQRIALHTKIDQVAKYLKLNQALLRFILNVFAETKMIAIEQGEVILQPQTTPVQLDKTTLMIKRREQLWLEKVFVYSNFSDLVKWLTQDKNCAIG